MIFEKYDDYKKFDNRHGGPFDRGSADSYYFRGITPHYYVGATYNSDRIDEENMTPTQIAEYMAGYEWNEKFGDRKDWG